MDGFDWPCLCLDFFGFDVNRLPDFVEATRLQAAIARDVRGDSAALAGRHRVEYVSPGEWMPRALELQGSREKD